MSIIKEFKEFAVKGNVVDMAVGLMIGAAFGTIVKSFVDDLVSPPLGRIIGGIDFKNVFLVLKDGTPPPPYLSLEQAKQMGAVTLNYGQFLTNVISFLITAFILFLFVKGINRLKSGSKNSTAEPVAKECPHCFSSISFKATRCPHCTSDIR